MRARWQQGFTLIEILVVVFIIGVILGFATLSLSGRALDDKAQEEARRLAEVLRLARDEASMTGFELGWRRTDKGYEFLALADEGWTPYGASTPLRPRDLPEPLRLEVRVDDLPVANEQDKALPQFMILSSGEMTPFTLVLDAEPLEFVFMISGNLVGELKLERLDRDAAVFRES